MYIILKKLKPFAITLLLLGIYGCGSAPPTFLQSDYENKTVETIGILELKDKSILTEEFQISKEDYKNVENVVFEEVQDRNYDVVGPLKYESFGIDAEKDLTKELIAEICEKEKVDAILFSSISKYEDNYLGQHTLAMNFKLFKADGDSIWVDKVDLDKNGLLGFVIFVGVFTATMLVYPYDPALEPTTDVKLALGLGVGVLGGLLGEALTNYISSAISERIETLPEGVGQGNRIR